MSIKTKTLVIVTIAVAILLVVLTTISYLLVTRRFVQLEIKQTETQVQRIHNEINGTLASLEATAADWAPWDNSYQFVEDLNQAYVAENLVDSTFTNLRLHFMLFFNSQGKLVYSRFFELHPDYPLVSPDILMAAIHKHQPLLDHDAVNDRVSGVLMTPSMPYLVASLPIVTSEFKGPMRGTLIMGRALDVEEIRRISTVTKSTVAIHRLDVSTAKEPYGRIDAAQGRKTQFHAVALDANTIAGYDTISDLSGTSALMIEITRDRDVYHYGLATWRQNAVAMAAFGLFFVLLLMVLLNRAMLTPLKELSLQVRELACSDIPSARLDVHGNDEIGQLAHCVNSLLASLHQSQFLHIESEERYRRFFEEDITGDFWTSADGRILDCNQAFATMFGYAGVEQIKSENMERFYPPNYLRQKLLSRIQKEKKLERVELEFVHRNGRTLYCIGNLTGEFSPSGALEGIRGYFLDDTQRVLLEKDLRQAHKLEAIGTLAGGIAHDFNNILSGIMGYTEIALMDLSSSSETAGRLKQALTAANRARELVQQILTFSRQAENDSRPIFIVPIISEVVKLMRASLPTTIDIRHQLNSRSTVLADPVQIHQVIMNLCTNAGQAMKKGGSLSVTVDEIALDKTWTDHYPGVSPGKFVRIAIQDTGEGIAPEIIDRIFEPFFTTKGKSEGTGLGLSVVHGIVTKLGGAITVSSLSHGTRFDIYLPLLEKEAESHDQQPVPLPKGSEAIVLVDDEAIQVDIGTQMLETLGYRVTGFTSSLKALDYILTNADKVDLVVTDLTMPQLTGAALAHRLLETFPHLPIILCSGYSEEVVSESEALAIGIRGFVMKPVVMHYLACKIREALDSKMSHAIPPPSANALAG